MCGKTGFIAGFNSHADQLMGNAIRLASAEHVRSLKKERVKNIPLFQFEDPKISERLLVSDEQNLNPLLDVLNPRLNDLSQIPVGTIFINSDVVQTLLPRIQAHTKAPLFDATQEVRTAVTTQTHHTDKVVVLGSRRVMTSLSASSQFGRMKESSVAVPSHIVEQVQRILRETKEPKDVITGIALGRKLVRDLGNLRVATTLVITHPVLSEVFKNLRAGDPTFKPHGMRVIHATDIVANSLVRRAYAT